MIANHRQPPPHLPKPTNHLPEILPNPRPSLCYRRTAMQTNNQHGGSRNWLRFSTRALLPIAEAPAASRTNPIGFVSQSPIPGIPPRFCALCAKSKILHKSAQPRHRSQTPQPPLTPSASTTPRKLASFFQIPSSHLLASSPSRLLAFLPSRLPLPRLLTPSTPDSFNRAPRLPHPKCIKYLPAS